MECTIANLSDERKKVALTDEIKQLLELDFSECPSVLAEASGILESMKGGELLPDLDELEEQQAEEENAAAEAAQAV